MYHPLTSFNYDLINDKIILEEDEKKMKKINDHYNKNMLEQFNMMKLD